MRDLPGLGMHLRLPDPPGPAVGVVVPVRHGLPLWRQLQLRRMPGCGRASAGGPVVHPDAGLLAGAGSLCMVLSLVLAWGLAGARASSVVKRCVASPQYLLKAHLDFLMMTGLLFVFFLLFEHLRLQPPAAVVVAMSLGSVGNPLGFLALALRPELPQTPTSVFGALMLLSFTATTIGYGGAAWLVARAVLHL